MLTGEEFADYWDTVGDFIEDIKYPQLKKFFPGMQNFTGDAKKLIMAGVWHVGAWVRGAAASEADEDPEGYDYEGEYIESIITSRDPDEWGFIIDDLWNDDDYEKYAKKMSRDGDGDGAMIVRWFEGEFLPTFFANWFEALKKKVGSTMEGKVDVSNLHRIFEARQIEYRAQLDAVQDSEGLPVTVTILVEKEHQKAFEKWLESEEGNTFGHAEGGNVEY